MKAPLNREKRAVIILLAVIGGILLLWRQCRVAPAPEVVEIQDSRGANGTAVKTARDSAEVRVKKSRSRKVKRAEEKAAERNVSPLEKEVTKHDEK